MKARNKLITKDWMKDRALDDKELLTFEIKVLQDLFPGKLDLFEHPPIREEKFDSARAALVHTGYIKAPDNYKFWDKSLPLVNYYEFHFELQAPYEIQCEK
jgi:hypothetical protein